MSDNKRLRILYIKEFFEEKTDNEHAAMIPDIIQYLKRYGIEAERRSVLDDIEALRLYGMDIDVDDNGKQRKLYSREFDYAEVEMLVDFVISSQSLSEDNSKKLIEKLEKLISKYQRRRYRRGEGPSFPFKSKNKSVMYTVDLLQRAIVYRSVVEFQYLHYNMKKEQELVDNGRKYHVKPKRLYFDNNCYYLLALEGEQIQSYRVDKMTNVNIVDQESFRWTYMKTDEIIQKRNEKEIQILFSQDSMDTVIDRFGEDVYVEIVDNDHFRVKVKVIPDQQFFGWIFELGEKAMIEYPLEVAAQMMDLLQERYKSYREEHSRNIYNYRRRNKPKIPSADDINNQNNERMT